MNGTLLALASYMVAIGWHGNSSKAIDQFSEDFSGFVPVIASIVGLTLLSKTRFAPVVTPFLTLAVITTIVRKFPIIEQDAKMTYDILSK